MSSIEVMGTHIVYENPMPHLRSRHGYFPGLVELAGGDILALFAMGEAFEAVDLTTCASRSADMGHTWELEGPICDKSTVGFPVSDFMKPTLLDDGSLIAMGYRFHRLDPEHAIGNPLTNGILPGDVIVSFSNDKGKTWTQPEVVSRSCPELIEVSGPCIQLRSGELLAGGGLFHMWDGSLPSGQKGVLLRSVDRGRTWDDSIVYFDTPGGGVSPFETRFCEMQDGRVVALVWAFDSNKGISLTNSITISHDRGRTWSKPVDTGIPAQASNLMWLGGDRLLTIHAHREGEVGLFVRIVDLAGDEWQVIDETCIWGNARSMNAVGLAEIGKSLRFGQPSLLRLSNGDILASHWSIEEGQGRILSHRLRVTGVGRSE